MRRMVRWLVLIGLLWAAPLAAQDTTDDDRGFLVELIEDALSDLGREVRVEGFEGALSSRATVDEITVADDSGIWLRLEDVALQWDRSALFSGRIDIAELRAGRIALLRPPVAEGSDLPAAEATPFALPELPVSVDIAVIAADRIEIGPEVLGQGLVARLDGSVDLAEGAGSARLSLRRIDGATGAFDLAGSYSNATRMLDLDLRAEEQAGGIAAGLLGIPGEPALALRLAGAGPIDDFAADLTLATDGQDRLSGQFSLHAVAPDGATDAGGGDRTFALDLAGDIRPLVRPDLHRFFGSRSRLEVSGTLLTDGEVDLHRLVIGAEQLVLRGTARFGSDGWPLAFDLRGRMGTGTGQPVTLPVGGGGTQVTDAAIELAYDASQGDGWAGRFQLAGFDGPGIGIQTLTLTGLGTLTPGNGADRGRVTGDLLYTAEGLRPDDPELAQALGDRLSGRVAFARLEGEPFVLQTATLTGAGLEADLGGFVHGPDKRFLTRVQARVRADSFARFSGLVGQSLGGGGLVELSGSLLPFDGMLDMDLNAVTRDLSVGVDRLVPLLRGESILSFGLARDEAGTRLTDLVLTGEVIEATGAAELTGDGVSATLSAALLDVTTVLPGLAGRADLDLAARTDPEGVIRLDTAVEMPTARAEAAITARPDAGGHAIGGEITLTAADLTPFSDLAGLRLGGALDARAIGTYVTASGGAEATITAETGNLSLGPQGLDRLLAGAGQLRLDLTRGETGRLRLNGIDAAFPNLTARGDVTITAEGQTRADLALRLADVGLFAPDFSGPATATVEATQDPLGWVVEGRGTGPAGTAARVAGRVGPTGQLALSVSGEAPLGLANVYIAPRQISGLSRFSLRVEGPPALASVTGPISVSGGRLAAPALRQAIEDISGTAVLSGAMATLDFGGTLAGGGSIALDGIVDLAAPFRASLTAELNRITLREPALYETTAQGIVRMDGPLAGGATISGRIDLGPTEVRVPSSPVSALGELPEVIHLGARPDVLRTLDRAGLSPDPVRTAATAGRPYPLDLTISAPSRIFVRGRGLDAELGGELRLTGTTTRIVPQGRFDLLRGRLDILGQRFDLDEGYAQLQGDFTPFLRLVATTEADTGTDVSIVIEGPADGPEVRFESRPELPQDEVLAQLLFGRDLSSISPLQAVQLASAISTLSGRGGGVLDNLREGLDLDDFDVTTDEDGNAAVRAGKYLNDNVYTDVTIGADGTSEINLNLDISDEVTARGSFGADGETSVGIFFERDY